MAWNRMLNTPTPIFQRIFKDVRLPGVECVVTYSQADKKFYLDLLLAANNEVHNKVLGTVVGTLSTSHSAEEQLRILSALARATLLAEKSPEELRELDESGQPPRKKKRKRKKKAKKSSNRRAS